MTRDEALKLLRGGFDNVAEWNRLRRRGADVPDLQGVTLDGEMLSWAELSGMDMRGSSLKGTVLLSAELNQTDLRGSDLSGAYLGRAILDRTLLDGAILDGAHFAHTLIACDLSGVKGLENINFRFESPISVNSVLAFRDELPESFLQGCGLRDEEIAYFRGMVGQPIRFYSCFISYSTADEEFATRLHNDFRAAGIRCWKWDDDARTGRTVWGEIDQAIRLHDKLVLIASESALKSPAVIREIERALQKEDDLARRAAAGEPVGDTNVLFPVRIDDYLFETWEHERKADVTDKVIADARGWERDPEVYARARDRLIRDLKPE